MEIDVFKAWATLEAHWLLMYESREALVYLLPNGFKLSCRVNGGFVMEIDNGQEIYRPAFSVSKELRGTLTALKGGQDEKAKS